MKKRTRRIVVFGGIACLLVLLELILDYKRGSDALVEVRNPGLEPITNLVITYGKERTNVGTIAPGDKARAFIAGRGEQPLVLSFRQKGNALGTYEIPSFDADGLREGQFKLVLSIRNNEVERYQDDSEATTPGSWVAQGVWRELVGKDDETQPQ
ncbi:MAG: hypothetical protein U0794_15530 [Isosphaeraceae bacterium]